MEELELITMEIHEELTSRTGNWNILRVVGGWIYTQEHSKRPNNSVFVPESE